MADEVKPEGGDQLNIKVRDQQGQEVFFKVKRTTKLTKLKKAYSERVGKPEATVRFMFDGNRIGDQDTAESLGLENDDVVDVLIEQIGGSAARC